MFPFFSRMFPGTNLQDLNLDWICRRIMELSKGIIAPWINPDTKDWMVYDTETEQFVDSGVSAAGETAPENAYSNPGFFKKIGVIGDSFASGVTWKNNNFVSDYSISWPKILAGMFGVEVFNYSFGGATTRAFINTANTYYSTRGMGKVLADITSKNIPGFLILALGVNDVSNVPVGDIYDMHDDYTQNPDTFYGNYGRIIGMIKNGNSAVRLAISGFTRKLNGEIPAEYAVYNQAIANIAERAGIPYIDMSTDVYFSSPDYLDMMDHNHPTATGYSGMAEAYSRILSKLFLNNDDYFKAYNNDGFYTEDTYHYGDVIKFNSSFDQYVGTIVNTSTFRVLIPLRKDFEDSIPRSFNDFPQHVKIKGGFAMRHPGGYSAISDIETDCTVTTGYEFNGVTLNIAFPTEVFAGEQHMWAALQPNAGANARIEIIP